LSSEDVVYGNDVDGLFRALGHVHNGTLGHVHNPEYLRVFIDSIELKLIKVHYRLHIITFPCISKLFK